MAGAFCFPPPRKATSAGRSPSRAGALMDAGCYPIHWVRTASARSPRWCPPSPTRVGRVDRAPGSRLGLPDGPTGEVTCSMGQAGWRRSGGSRAARACPPRTPMPPPLGRPGWSRRAPARGSRSPGRARRTPPADRAVAAVRDGTPSPPGSTTPSPTRRSSTRSTGPPGASRTSRRRPPAPGSGAGGEEGVEDGVRDHRRRPPGHVAAGGIGGREGGCRPRSSRVVPASRRTGRRSWVNRSGWVTASTARGSHGAARRRPVATPAAAAVVGEQVGEERARSVPVARRRSPSSPCMRTWWVTSRPAMRSGTGTRRPRTRWRRPGRPTR